MYGQSYFQDVNIFTHTWLKMLSEQTKKLPNKEAKTKTTKINFRTINIFSLKNH